MNLSREQAMALLQKYNQESFHIQHALTVEGVMAWYAKELGFDVEFWSLCGLLHDVDFEQYPDHRRDGSCHLLPRLRPVQRRRACSPDGEGHVRGG